MIFVLSKVCLRGDQEPIKHRNEYTAVIPQFEPTATHTDRPNLKCCLMSKEQGLAFVEEMQGNDQ